MRPRTQPTPPASPQVGSYRLLTKIGEGGMGVVHLAQGPDGRRVALKVLRPHIIGDDEARERLSREVASLRRVRSPRIAEVIDADPWGEIPFVATRYVPGLSLHEHVRQHGPITGDDLRHLAAGLAEAVIAVHSVGVLHRDIKPSNVLLEGRSPVLIDFGLARLAEDPRMTVTGWLLGTPGYLAPEILYGEDATHASDVHSWAATLVFAATGEPPFGRGPAMAIMDRVRRGEHDLSAVPPELAPLIHRCLSPNAQDRPEMPVALALLGGHRAPHDMLTMPIALTGPDGPPTAPTAPSATQTIAADPTRNLDPTRDLGPAPTRPFTTLLPAEHPVRPVQQAARAPYVSPAPPQQQPFAAEPPEPWRPPAVEASPLRGALLFGLFALVTVGFALAPYVSLLLLSLAVLVVRTFSWTTESARDRQWRRGRRRWYDGPLTVATSPWYLVVAVGGTTMLLAWSTAIALLVGLAYAPFRLPVVPGLLLMGAVLALSLWWGPGSRRLRVPTRRIVVRLTRWSWLGWLTLAACAAGILLCGLALDAGGVVWDPQPGPPWRGGTMLGDLLRLL